ncbi:uncharacterized protein [Heterodontus francisci]|uniref:uncharacterized protein n=1 Tax=Heterodontus francisci TaxID=7792 RepID=UPI00355BE861
MATGTLQLLWVPLAVLLLQLQPLIHSIPFQALQNCTKNQYFDISRMTCAPCGDDQQTSGDGTSCVCLPGYRLISNNGGPSIKCKKCPAFYSAVTQDGWNCISCPSGAIIDHQGKCQCPKGYILVERNATGAPLIEALCEVCDPTSPSFSTPDPSANRCIRCHETFINTTKSCDCRTNMLVRVFMTGGLCFLARPKILTASVVTNIIYGKVNIMKLNKWWRLSAARRRPASSLSELEAPRPKEGAAGSKGHPCGLATTIGGVSPLIAKACLLVLSRKKTPQNGGVLIFPCSVCSGHLSHWRCQAGRAAGSLIGPAASKAYLPSLISHLPCLLALDCPSSWQYRGGSPASRLSVLATRKIPEVGTSPLPGGAMASLGWTLNREQCDQHQSAVQIPEVGHQRGQRQRGELHSGEQWMDAAHRRHYPRGRLDRQWLSFLGMSEECLRRFRLLCQVVADRFSLLEGDLFHARAGGHAKSPLPSTFLPLHPELCHFSQSAAHKCTRQVTDGLFARTTSYVNFAKDDTSQNVWGVCFVALVASHRFRVSQTVYIRQSRHLQITQEYSPTARASTPSMCNWCTTTKRLFPQCSVCNEYHAKQAKEPLMTHDIPDRPWMKLGADLFTLTETDYLVTVDYYSDYWEIDLLTSMTTELSIGEPVRVQTFNARKKSQPKWQLGACVEQLSPRSYAVEVNDQIYRRNHRHIRTTGEAVLSKQAVSKEDENSPSAQTTEQPSAAEVHSTPTTEIEQQQLPRQQVTGNDTGQRRKINQMNNLTTRTCTINNNLKFNVHVAELMCLIIGRLPRRFQATLDCFYNEDSILLGTEEEILRLQDDIDQLVRWAEQWPMEFKLKKCGVMHFGRTNKAREYTMDDEMAERKLDAAHAGQVDRQSSMKFMACLLKRPLRMEEFKNSIPSVVETHIDNLKVLKARQAAEIADDFELVNKPTSFVRHPHKPEKGKKWESERKANSREHLECPRITTSEEPSEITEMEKLQEYILGIFPVCVVTRAMAKQDPLSEINPVRTKLGKGQEERLRPLPHLAVTIFYWCHLIMYPRELCSTLSANVVMQLCNTAPTSHFISAATLKNVSVSRTSAHNQCKRAKTGGGVADIKVLTPAEEEAAQIAGEEGDRAISDGKHTGDTHAPVLQTPSQIEPSGPFLQRMPTTVIHSNGQRTEPTASTSAAIVGGTQPQMLLPGCPRLQNLKVSSAWFITHLKASAIACLRFANLTACQALGNMCVMTMNSINMATPPNDACGLFQTIFKKTVSLGITHSISSWRKTLPWLYYESEYGLPSRILNQEPFQTVFHFKEFPHMELNFVVAKYDGRGYFLNWEKVTGGTLQLCPDTMTRLNAAYIFGITYQQKCTLPVSKLLSMHSDPQFYDIYMLYKGEDGEDKLQPIAIRNVNLQYNGEFVNQDNTINNWYLTRRIFLVDTLSGREINLDNQPKVIRVASDIQIRINLVPNTLQGKIFPPTITVTYTNIKIQNPDLQTIPISFSVEYEMDLSAAYQNTKIALGFLCGLSTIYSVLRTASWKRRIGSPMIDIPTILKFLLFYAGDLANTFFIVTFGTGLYWLIFFKGQQIVSVLLPTPSQEMHFISCVASAFVLKLLQLLHKLGLQLTVDIFFIDWERPKGKIVKSFAGGGDIKTAPAPVSIWRTYFVANEWNNIQTIRKINPIFQIIAVLFFLEVLGFANLTSMDPYSILNRTAESYVAPSSRILRFGMATTIWLTVGLVQIIFRMGIYERFVEDRINQFIDVCSISNISVIILSHRCFGYYIHGRSVHGHADTNMEEMNLNLKREAENLCAQRGLIPNTEIETFQISITSKIREQYDKIREPLHWSSVSGQLLNSSGDSFEHRVKAYNTTNKFLGSFIDHALRDMDYIVQDKLLLERLIGMELHEPIDKTIFYNDENLSFTDVLYYGNESTLLMFDTLFFCVVDLATQSFIFAAFLTFVQQKIIQFIRHAVGRKNLAAKTLVDERFLL